MWAAQYLCSVSLNHFSHPSPFLFLCPSFSEGQCSICQHVAGKCEKKGNRTRETAQDGGGGGVGRKRKKAMYSAFVLIISPWLGDIQAASVHRLGFGRRVISGSAGECLQCSSISHTLRRWVKGIGVCGVRRCSLTLMYGRSGQLPSYSMLGNEEMMSQDMN